VAVAHRIYAEALFEAAKEAGRLQQVHEQLSDFVAAVAAVAELRAVLRSPQLDPSAKVDVLEEVLGGADELVRNFLLLAAEKGRIGEIEEIGREFDRLVAHEERRLKVELTTATELTEADAASIVAQIESASGRKVEATRNVDASLIGGIVLRAGSLQVDASVRGKLNRLRHELAKS
jgi:F-type H+-transporting ATPase subunit delta